MLGLLLIVIGDFASFNIALSRSFTTMSTLMVLMLTIAMTAAAVLLMVEAGRAEAKRRSRNAGRSGKGPVRTRVAAWVLLGITAFALRMAAPPEETGTGGFGQDSGFGGGLGGAGQSGGFGADAVGSTDFSLGPLTLHGVNLASALALLAIFVAGGVGAFWFGKETYNPRITRLRRASAAERKARRRLRRAQRAHDEQSRRLGELTSAARHVDEARVALHHLDVLQHETVVHETAVDLEHQHLERAGLVNAELADTRAELSSLPERTHLRQGEAAHAGEEAKRRARVLIANYWGDPGATTGLTNGNDQ